MERLPEQAVGVPRGNQRQEPAFEAAGRSSETPAAVDFLRLVAAATRLMREAEESGAGWRMMNRSKAQLQESPIDSHKPIHRVRPDAEKAKN